MKSGHLKEFVLEPRGPEIGQTTRPWGNPSLTSIGCNRSHTYCFKGYFSDPKKGGVDRGASRKLSRMTIGEENEICSGIHCFQ